MESMVKASSRDRAGFAFALSVACLALLLSTSASASQPESVQIIEIDDYSKEVAAGGTVTYNWTLRSLDPSGNLTVNTAGSVSGEGWTFTIVPSVSNLTPNGLAGITLTATAPSEYGSLSSNISVAFSVYQDSYLIQKTEVYVISTVSGALGSADQILEMFDNPLPPPLDNEWGVFLLDVLIWLAIALVVTYGTDRGIRLFTKKTTTMLDDIILDIVRTPVILIIFMFGAVQSLDALHKYIPGDIRDTIWSIYQIALVMVLFYMAYKLFSEILVYYGKLMAKKTASNLDDVLVPVVEKLGIVVIGIAAAGYVLTVLQVDLTMFVAGGVVVSMVLAFAAQETLSNFFSGIFILLDRPFAEGDTVILSDGDWCEIRKIGLRTTRLYRFSDATMITLPNNRLVNEKIVRVSNVQDPARVNINVNVAYGTDPKKARDVIMGAIKANKYALLDNEAKHPLVLFDSMADSSLMFKIIVWINDSDKRLEAQDTMTEGIYNALNKAGIEIPLRQTVVHLKKVD